MKILRKVFVSLFCLMLVLLLANTVVFALGSADVTVSSPSHGYFFPGESLSYYVTISGEGNNPATVKVYYPYSTYNSQPRTFLKTLTRIGSSFNYNGSSYPSISTWVPGKKPGSHSGWVTRSFYVEVTKDGTTVAKKADGYITYNVRSSYTANDSTFWYNTSTSNSFYGVGTPTPDSGFTTYNCLAYAVSVNTSWLWPWGMYNPTLQQLDDYMAKSGNYSSRPGYSFTSSTLNGCDVIYYSNQNWGSYHGDGHFAKVVAWNASGTPTMIMSKWGCGEIIESTQYNPFTGNSYGAPKRYYKLSGN